MRKACFLDRDGVLIEEENYLGDPAKARLCAGTCEALRLLRDAGYALVAVSNQSGVARGYFTMADVKAVERRVDELLAEGGASIDAWLYCPHLPGGKVKEHSVECQCRKPEPGMLLQAAKDLSLDLPGSMMIGDKASDIEAAFRAGCKLAALVRTGHGMEQDLSGSPALSKAIVADGMLSAAKLLLEAASKES